jgi:hypothetical protein
MGERRVTSLVSQKTLAGASPVSPPEPPIIPEATPLPPPDPAPRPVLYAPVVSSSDALHARQLRWLEERARRAAALAAPKVEDES